MSIVNHTPEKNTLDTRAFDWDSEQTLVDRRKTLPVRIWRFIRSIFIPVVIVVIVVAALFDAEFMTTFITAMGFILQLMFAISFIAIQFLAMYWFVSRSRMYTIMPGTEGIGFDDYRGQPEVLEQAEQIVMLLRGVKAFENAGGEPLNGLLLEGPPGTGKTRLAQAISTEAGVPFYYVDTASLQGMFMGVGSMKVARMYSRARKKAKDYGAAVIFLDEIDSVGARAGVSTGGSGGGLGGGMGGMMGGGGMGLLSTLLIEMSGFSLEHGWRARLRTRWYRLILRRDPPPPQKRVLTIGATNRVQALDAALLRPGRFDKKLRIDVPDGEGRREVFEYYLSKMAHDDSMDPIVLATETPGYSPADITYVLNESLRYGLFSGRRYMNYEDFQRAKTEHEAGVRQPIKHISQEARERIAFRQAARAVAIRVFLPEYRIARISVIRQGPRNGHVSAYPAREAYQGMGTRDLYFRLLGVASSERASEIEFFGLKNQSLSVGEDYARIRAILGDMARAGMLGPLGGALRLNMTSTGLYANLSPEMSRAMEEQFQKTLTETRRMLRKHEVIVRELAALLLEREEMLADDVRAFFDTYGLYTPDPTLVRDGEEISLLAATQKPAELPEGAAGD